MERDLLYVEGHYFMPEFTLEDEPRIQLTEVSVSQSDTDKVEVLRDLIKQEEDARREDRGENAGILNYSVFGRHLGDEIYSLIQA